MKRLLTVLIVPMLISVSFAAEPTSKPAAIRIDAGATKEWKDSAGNTWLADKGFKDGDTVDRAADLKVANTQDAAIYRSERYGMTAFSLDLPNGKYTVKLHFAETSDTIAAAGDRVFSMKVEDKEIKDFDIWAKAGGREKAHVESVDVEVTDGKLDITFTAKTQNPAINGVEIIPADAK